MSAAAASPMALLRLVARPASLWHLFPLFLGTVWPFAGLLDSGADPFGSILRGDASPALRVAAWQFSILFGAAAGLVVSLPRIEIQHSFSAWTLPGLRNGLLLGQWMAGAVAALVAAALMWRVASPVEAAAASSACLASLVLVGLILDVAAPSPVRWLAGATLIAAVIRPEMLASLGASWPLLLAAAGVVLVVSATVPIFGADSARLRPFRFSGAVGTASPTAIANFWARGGSERPWSTDLATNHTLRWLRAAEYESFGARRFGFAGDRVLTALVFAVAASIVLESGLLAMVGIALASRGLQLRRSLHHPVSRAQRATLAYLGSLADAAVTCILTAIFFVPVASVARTLLPTLTDPAGTAWLVVLAFAFAWSPLAQWAVARGRSLVSTSRAPLRIMFQQYGLFLLFMVVVGASTTLLRRFEVDEPRALMAAGGVALLMQALHGVALRRHYARADLHGP
jgi:hypothetical protein